MSFRSSRNLQLQALPEGCIANVLSLTSPKDACRLLLISSTFRSAAESDAVWERFLPPDYRDIISRSIDGSDSLLGKFRSMKQLYFHLCDNPILIDGATKSFSLEKETGKKCFMLAARDLFIWSSDSSENWQWISLPESRFSEVAELLHVGQFGVEAKINTNMLSSGTKYAAYLVFTSKSGRVYGFEYEPADGSILARGQEGERQNVCCLDPEEGQRHTCLTVPKRIFFTPRPAPLHRSRSVPPESNTEYPKRRKDGWMEVELGEFFVNGKKDWDMEMTLTQFGSGNQKKGLIIQGIEIRPKAG